MLHALDIQNVILIDRLHLGGNDGLVALTGETGAGKSILLDALGLALGARAKAGMVRHGAEQASVSAVFDLPLKHPAFALLKDKGIETDGSLILRRTVARDGRSKAYINDAPVSVQLLRDVGTQLVEIHGQFETQGLLDPATHIGTLDMYAGIDDDAIRAAYAAWKAAKDKLDDALAGIESLKMQEEYLKHVVKELEALDPQPGEEEILADKRQRLKNHDKLITAFDAASDIIEGDDGIRNLLTRLSAALGRLELAEVTDAIARASAEIDEVSFQIEKKKSGGPDLGKDRLEDVEERYFSLKEMAKKHRTTPDALPAIYEDLKKKLLLITDQDAALADLQKAVAKTRADFLILAEKASAARKTAALKLSKAVNAELPDLKLEKASFKVETVASPDEKDWSYTGIDHVVFTVSTNPGAPSGPLHKIASGGELSRLMLALKVILAEKGSVPTLIFDEVDSGIGGATADAVGERLQRLSKKYQVLVVTHSPQVAARAKHHWHVAKSGKKDSVTTSIVPLKDITARAEEIARMLSGASITAEARAQAKSLLKNAA